MYGTKCALPHDLWDDIPYAIPYVIPNALWCCLPCVDCNTMHAIRLTLLPPGCVWLASLIAEQR
eukprot:1503128-Pyramimonas_sp.AAC.1